MASLLAGRSLHSQCSRSQLDMSDESDLESDLEASEIPDIDSEGDDAGGRVVFEGNPWPNGHALVSEFVDFGISISDAGLALHAGLKTVHYDADDVDGGGDGGGQGGDWNSKGVWCNYGKCHLELDEAPLEPCDLGAFLGGAPLRADPENTLAADREYDFYLLGHDYIRDHVFAVKSVYEHEPLASTPGAPPERSIVVDVEWTAAIELEDAEEEKTEHRMVATLERVPFRGVQVQLPSVVQGDAARRETALALAQKFMLNAQQLDVHVVDSGCWLVVRDTPPSAA